MTRALQLLASALLVVSAGVDGLGAARRGQGRPDRLRPSPPEHDQHRRAEEVLRRHARRHAHQDRHQQRRDRQVPERADLLPSEAGADRRHAGNDRQPHRLLGAQPPSGGRQDQGERLPDDHQDGSRAGPRGDGRHRRSAAARRRIDRVRAGARRREGRARRERSSRPIPITLHHVHFFNPKNAEMQAWYVKTFGAKPRAGRRLPVGRSAGRRAELLAVARSGRRHAGTRARSHRLRGEEPRGVLQEARSRRHQAGPSRTRKVPALGIAIAFFTDPWGTYIELTEGLDKVP